MGDTSSFGRPFVDFYRALDISPVRQDISDIEQHYQRRDSLYRSLGIPSSAVRGARVIEFGPGSGFNALHTASLGPSSYTLVDANPRGVADMRKLFSEYAVLEGVDIRESLIEEFEAASEYDVVLAEGLVVLQREPTAFARRLARFARPGGLVVLTCSDAVSVLSEIGRRLIAQRLAPPELPLSERMFILRNVFTPHLATLSGMSRSVEDWILDNIIQPVGDGKLFSIRDAIGCLASSYDVYGSSPRFFTDWRWYKEVTGTERGFNERAIRNYEESVLNLLDYRFVHPGHPAALGRALLSECEACYALLPRAAAGEDVWDEVGCRLNRLVALVSPIEPRTARSIESLRLFLSSLHPEPSVLEEFGPFFGRGMQYLSFIRRR